MVGLRTLLILACAISTLASWAKADTACPRAVSAAGAAAASAPAMRLIGTIVKIDGAELTVKTRTVEDVLVYAGPALDAQQSTVLMLGRSVDILGTVIGPNGLVSADVIRRAKGNPAGWPPDCLAAP